MISDRVAGEISQVATFRFMHDLVSVRRRRFEADPQFRRNFFGAFAEGKEPEHFNFPRGQ